MRWLIALPIVCLVSMTAHAQRPVATIVADLSKGEKEQLAAIAELDALGPKAADAAPALVALLRQKNEDVRLQATIAVGKIGKPAVELLAKELAAPDADTRFYAAWGLAFIGPDATAATPAIVKALGDSSAQVRRKAAYALGRINPDPETAVAALVGLLGDADEDVRQAAQASLPGMGKVAVTPLIKALASDKPALRNIAIQTLGQIGASAEAAVPELKAFLLDQSKGAAELAADALAGIKGPALAVLQTAATDENGATRILALRYLQKVGAPAVPVLVDLLGAKHVDVRRQAAALLGGMQVQDKMVVIGLGYATKDPDYQVKRNALGSLRGMGTGAKLAEPYISELLVDIDPQLRQEAFHTLATMGVDAKPGLKKALSNPDPKVRINTASLMAALNLEVALAEPILLEGLKHQDTALKMQAAYAMSLRGLQPDVVVPIFIAGLKSDVASVRRQAAESIARYGAKAKAATESLIAALEDTDDGVAGQALQTLRQTGSDAKSLFPAMVKVLRRKDTALHAAASQVIYQLGPDAIGDMIALLKKEDAPGVRLTCLQALAMVGPPAKDAVDDMVNALADPSPRIRLVAARCLGNIGPDAKGARDALTKATKDGDNNVRSVAAAALVQIAADPNQKEFQVQGVLTAGDPIDKTRPGCFHVVHNYPMKAGQTYTIDLSSPWDNFLRLENAQGQQLAADDDSGGNLNARIIHRCTQDGWHRIIATSFGQNATGNYTLKVR